MNVPNRKLQRLRDYDYSTPGTYFVTICSYEKKCIFGKITPANSIGEARIRYSHIGEIAKDCLLQVEKHFPNCRVDHWVIMPNHIHMLLSIDDQVQRTDPVPVANVSHIIGTFKAAVTRTVGNAYMHSGKLWQTSFYDHIVRNDEDYQNIWNYIGGNPSKWLEDRFYCE